MSEFSPDLRKKILHAQSVGDSPPEHTLVAFKNIGSLLSARADRLEQSPFLIFFDDEGHRKEFSYREFYEDVCKTANVLRARGVRRGDRIATVAYNHSDTVVQYFAAFLVENEIQDQFGLHFDGLALDYDEGLYLEEEAGRTPF